MALGALHQKTSKGDVLTKMKQQGFPPVLLFTTHFPCMHGTLIFKTYYHRVILETLQIIIVHDGKAKGNSIWMTAAMHKNPRVVSLQAEILAESLT